MGSKTSKVSGTGQYVSPDTSNALYQQLQSGGTYDPSKWINQGLSSYISGIGAVNDLYSSGISGQVAGLQGTAQSTAENATSQYGESARALAQAQAKTAQESVASEYAGSGALNSGAALSAIASGTATPLLSAETDIANQYANVYSNTANSLYSNAYNSLNNQASNLSSLYSGLGSNQYGYGSELMSLLGQLGSSSYIAPQYTQSAGLGSYLLSGLSSGIGSGVGTLLGGLSGQAKQAKP